MSQFQKPDPEPNIISPRRTANTSPRSSQGGITSPRGGSQIISSTTNTSPRNSVISPRGGSQIITSSSNSSISSRNSQYSNKSSPSASPTSPLSPNSTNARDILYDLTTATITPSSTAPKPTTTPIPTQTYTPTPTANPIPAPVQTPTPPPPPKVVVLPKSPTRAVVHSPSVDSTTEVDDDRVYTFQELRAMMAKKLPSVLISLAATLGNMHVEDNHTDASKVDTWEHFKNKVSPPAPTELQMLSSLTKDRAKPPPQRRGRTKPSKGGANKAEPTSSGARVNSTPTATPTSISPTESTIPVAAQTPISSSISRQRPQSYDPPHNAQTDPLRAGGAPLVRPLSYSPSPSVPSSSPVLPPSLAFSNMRPQSFSPTPSPGSPSAANRPHSQPPARQTAAISLISSKSPRRYIGNSLEPGMAPKNVIGVDPSTLTYMADSGFKVPNFLVWIKNLILKNRGNEKEGIFRVGGREDTISKLGQDIEDGVTDLVCDDVYSSATYLKRWYSRLPQKLLGALSHADIDSIYDNPNKTKAMLKAKLNETYYALFWWLMAFMHFIASKEESNKMGPKNLATVFGPILREVGADMADLQRNQRLVSVVQHILEYGVSG